MKADSSPGKAFYIGRFKNLIAMSRQVIRMLLIRHKKNKIREFH
tara:strand:- start:1640 stop:1771 length:132 start_codon:yes stop_codon:yes gene_type:complete